MAAKGSKKNESKKNDKSETPVYAKPWEDPEWRRHEIVDPHRVHAALEKLKLATNGKELERIDRLSFYYVHEAQQGHLQLARCLPNDDADPLGCGFASDETLDVCPFCGSGAEVIVAPKAPPPADRDIELNVKAAETKFNEADLRAAATIAKGLVDKGVAKVSSKDVKKKKEARGEVIEDKPAEPVKETPKPDAIVPAAPEAIDLPSESVGGTAADLDRMSQQIDRVMEGMAKNQALSMWEIGSLLAEIRDKKLWSTVRNDGDGGYVYATFNSFVAQRFDLTPDHSMIMMRIATAMTQKQAESLGITKAKAILDANNARNSEPITDAQRDELILLAPDMSVSELRAKIKRMQLPQLPAGTAASAATASHDEDGEDRDDDLDEDDDDDANDEDDDDEPESSKSTPAKSKAQPAQMTSVSFEKREFSVPLAIKGSQVKPAKKIQDEPHGTLSLPGGTKIHFVLKIGDDGQIFVDGKVETPY